MSRSARVEALLRDLGSDLDVATSRELEAPPLCATGLSEVDALLGGGLPRGRLCEISGPVSSGRTSLALSLLATTTRAGHCAGLIDRSDAFDPSSAEHAGVRLEQVLWVRPRSFDETRRCTERLLETDGFPLVLVDLAHSDDAAARDAQTWLRLTRLASGTRSALVVLSHERRSGGHAHIALEMQPGRACFSEAPSLLEEIEVEVVLVRHRAAPVGRRAALRLGRGCEAA